MVCQYDAASCGQEATPCLPEANPYGKPFGMPNSVHCGTAGSCWRSPASFGKRGYPLEEYDLCHGENFTGLSRGQMMVRMEQ